MTTRAGVLAMCSVALAMLGDAAVANRANPDRLTYLTFSRAVALPGVTLDAGTYAFDITNPESSADVVRVRNAQRNKLYFVGLTRTVRRPAALNLDRSVQFGEASKGIPAPILAWYPRGEERGYQFLYPQ